MRESRPLWMELRVGPRVSNRAIAVDRFAEILAAATPATKTILLRPRVRALLMGVSDQSSYLWQLIRADPLRLQRVLRDLPQARLDAILGDLGRSDPEETEAAIMQRLRWAKQETALLIGLADLGGVWRLEDVLQALSLAADVFIATALVFLLRKLEASGKLTIANPDNPAQGCGLAILGLGKLGGRELNYSSDVDVITIFDPQNTALVRPDEAGPVFIRVIKDLVRILQTRTADGYVLRVDLRLRPDPGATAVAIGIGAAFLYYERYGQNWERAAMIKARPVAGDVVVGQTFVDGLAPFIWRKYFDYAAIADIHAMKRQIHASKGHAVIAVAGHNVKLGRGGIREIEFFVQTQQLIFGGKRPDLRGSRTLPMLRRLQRDGWVTRKAVGDLTRAYKFLRDIEHRLQMIADEQTHKLPSDPDTLDRFARFAGFASTARFAAVLTRHLSRVVTQYAMLFENAPGLDDVDGNLVFTGVADDPETIETLTRLGFKAPSVVAQTVRTWHSGRKPAVRTARARETLTDLVPKLLQTFGRTGNPDAALAAFDAALERMPGAAELFAILASNAALRTLFGDILGSAPRLARAVTQRPHLLDAAINPPDVSAFDDAVATAATMAALPMDAPTEGFLDALRDVGNEEHFLIGLRLLSGALDVDDAGLAYSALAVGVIRAALRHVTGAFEVEHGRVTGGVLAVVAMGKLGSREMTATSDLDVVVLYDFDAAQPESDGARPLHATQYFTRLTQRLVSALTVATRRGRLYQVDMRLRPSGQQGPLATKLGAFLPYQRTEADTWEHMALTRARVIAGDVAFAAIVTDAITAILCTPPKAVLKHDVAQMRALIARAKPAKTDWDLKLVPGGLIDIEFIAQYLVLRNAYVDPACRGPGTQTILEEAGRLGRIDAASAATLIEAHRLYTRTTQIMRLALDDDQRPDAAGDGVKRRLAAAANLPDFARLTDELRVRRQAVSEIFAAVFSGA
ncbi:bifunctional [glutamine synthetase] adenylyltransferase/[glutamine synthetase]-adenylyl-L-tyrosine phosphorylase [Beijerinckia sp. L45]|uniref:bifunctional [glutamine synthetase] adenylyltransferase/[glutamine synthetase]-adenylyl-L-tyrosine phosphorylase n=1 Tax=Beijerinckia sp. L45 TaxID=1641855 RepID=UPI001FEE59AE|nr:bifunctional [glutamine synthetase] adenylyltransferase/[glutamine synthetase]-adenylyl-L-tyrosine phosphorylase [Beijerinckia sp. L45]